MSGQLSLLPAHVPDEGMLADVALQLELTIPIIACDPVIALQLWRPGNDNAMAKAAIALHGGALHPWLGTELCPAALFGDRDESAAIGRRWANLLDILYPPPYQEIYIARAFDVLPRTARSWLGGQAPFAKYLARAARLHGPGLLQQVLAPDAPSHTQARLAQALDEIDARLAQVRDAFTVLKRVS